PAKNAGKGSVFCGAIPLSPLKASRLERSETRPYRMSVHSGGGLLIYTHGAEPIRNQCLKARHGNTSAWQDCLFPELNPEGAPHLPHYRQTRGCNPLFTSLPVKTQR
ncbi:MAG: hypothetical protein K9J27_07165, partial [Bacteroidales bacterium]|nr:hypothetical protein [Bacteroidales bacterium]